MIHRALPLIGLLALLLAACSSDGTAQAPRQTASAAQADLATAQTEWETLIFADYFDTLGTIGGGWRFEPVQNESGSVFFTRDIGSLNAQVASTTDTIWWNAPLVNQPYGEDYILRITAGAPSDEQLRYGMVFWWETPQNYYSLLFGPNNSVAVDHTVGEETENVFLSENEAALQPRINTMTVLIFNDELANIFINEEWVTTITRQNAGTEFAIALETPANLTASVTFTAVEILAP